MDTNISFVSSEISGLYSYLVSEEDFNVLRLNKEDSAYDKFKKEIQKNIINGAIKNVNDLNDFINKSFPDRPDKVEEFCKSSLKKADEYSQFYHEHSDAIEKYKNTVDKTQTDPDKGYEKDLSKLYDFFGVDKSFKCYGILAPVPQKRIDGLAQGDAFIMFYGTEKQGDRKYIDESLLQERKVSTPLHEATHMLFGQSLMKKEVLQSLEQSNENKLFYQQNTNGVTALLSTLETYFDKNPDAKQRDGDNVLESVKLNSLFSIDEALAACAGATIQEKYTQRKDTDEFYHGFKGADTLARSLYPVFLDYTAQGKKIDDNFFMEVAGHFKIKEYTNLIKNNIEDLTAIQENATCQKNQDSSWTLKINQEDDIDGKHIVETREIHVNKELADHIFAGALENEMRNEATYYLYEAEYKKEHPEFDYRTADKETKNAFKRAAIDWFKIDPENHQSEAEKYVAAHRDELSKSVQEKLLKEKILEQVVVNYATSKTIENADKEAYQSTTDIGHCSKSVLTYMYQLQKQNGGYSFLPEDPNVAAQPVQLFEHFHENWPQKTKQTDDIAGTFKNHQPPYEQGTLALIDNGHGRHLMMYRGINKDGEPEFLGFNPLAEHQVLKNQKAGEIIDIPSLIRDETCGALTPSQKQISAENLQTTERGLVSVDMTITRTKDGKQIQGFQGKIEIPNPVQPQTQKNLQKTNKDNAYAETILEKTGRPHMHRGLPRVQTKTKEELKKLGLWDILKKDKSNSV